MPRARNRSNLAPSKPSWRTSVINGTSKHARGGQSGQAIVIMALAMVALLLGAALVIDGGNAFAQQRRTQNGADAAALAGATVMVQKVGGAAKTDGDVCAAIAASAGPKERARTTPRLLGWEPAPPRA